MLISILLRGISKKIHAKLLCKRLGIVQMGNISAITLLQ